MICFRATLVALAWVLAPLYGAPANPRPIPGTAVVFGDLVNIRDQASAQGTVKWKARIGQAVSLVTQGGIFTQNKVSDYWYGVEAGDRTGFIWGGLLSDAAAHFRDHQILSRVAGPLRDQVEVRLVSNQQQVGTVLWKSGAVTEPLQMKILPWPGDGFSHPPAFFFSVAVPVKSEIEGSQPLAMFFSFKSGTAPRSQITWVPGFSDPPARAETTPVFPLESIQVELPPAPVATNTRGLPPKKGSKPATNLAPAKMFRSFIGESNTILLVDDRWEMGDRPAHEYRVRKIVWDGTNLQPAK